MDSFHQNRMSSVALLLENESWSQAEVPSEFQMIVDNLTHTKLPGRATRAA